MAEGTDYHVLRGEDLAALKAAAPGLVDPRAPSLLLLTESGVHLVALLSRQPAAARLRRWLASEVLPALRRSGSYTAPGAAPALPDLSAVPPELHDARFGDVVELLHAERALGHPLPALRAALRARPAIPVSAEAVFGVQPEAERALALVLPWTQAHRADFDRGDGHGDAGRWLDGPSPELAVRASQIHALLRAQGHPVSPTLRAWAARGWLIRDGVHLAPKRACGRRSIRCIVFTAAALQRAPGGAP